MKRQTKSRQTPGLGLLLIMTLASGCRNMGPTFDPRAEMASGPAMATNAFVTTAPAKEPDPGWLLAPTNRFTLGPGDEVEIEIVGESGSRATGLIGPDGRLYYYILPGQRVGGLTLAETKALLERELMSYIRGEPKVTLTLRTVESKRVWLLGRLNTPGIYPLAGPMTLLEAIALAGGPANPPPIAAHGGSSAGMAVPGDVADLRHSFVMRQGKLLPVDFQRLLREGDLTQNIYLRADDLVYLPSAANNEVFVLGAVTLPRAVSYAESMTLAAAIAGAGGPAKHAHLTHVAIVRGSLARPRIAIVDWREIVRGRGNDVTLEPGDIVFVPTTPYRTAARYLDLILDTFARTVGANEGARAVTRGSVPVGVNVPLGP